MTTRTEKPSLMEQFGSWAKGALDTVGKFPSKLVDAFRDGVRNRAMQIIMAVALPGCDTCSSDKDTASPVEDTDPPSQETETATPPSECVEKSSITGQALLLQEVDSVQTEPIDRTDPAFVGQYFANYQQIDVTGTAINIQAGADVVCFFFGTGQGITNGHSSIGPNGSVLIPFALDGSATTGHLVDCRDDMPPPGAAHIPAPEDMLELYICDSSDRCRAQVADGSPEILFHKDPSVPGYPINAPYFLHPIGCIETY